jgi:hypothetical protein
VPGWPSADRDLGEEIVAVAAAVAEGVAGEWLDGRQDGLELSRNGIPR